MRNLMLIIRKVCLFSIVSFFCLLVFYCSNPKLVRAYSMNPTTEINLQSVNKIIEYMPGGGSAVGTVDGVTRIDSSLEVFTGSKTYTAIAQRTYKKWKPNFTYNYHVETAYRQDGYYIKFKEKLSIPFYHYNSTSSTISITTGKIVSEEKASSLGLKYKLDMGGGDALEVGYERVKKLEITSTMTNSYAVTLNSNNLSGYYTFYAVYHYQMFKSVDVFGPKSDPDKYTETLEAKILVSSDYAIRLAYSGQIYY